MAGSRLSSWIPRMYGSLDAAEASQVGAVGTLAVAALACRRSVSTVQAYTSPENPDTHMPLDVLARLQAAGSGPDRYAVLQHFAAAAGLLLLEPPVPNSDPDWIRKTGDVAKESGDLVQAVLARLADDHDLTSEEIPPILVELDEAIYALLSLKAGLHERQSEHVAAIAATRSGNGAGLGAA